MTYLFVYGTLRSTAGTLVSARLAREATLIGAAKIPGRVIQLDGYPGLVEPRSPNDWVNGELHDLETPEASFPWLDNYEGAEFSRVRATATLASAETLECWVYRYVTPPRS